MDPLKLLALAIGPIAFIFTYVYLRDRFDREPLRYLIVTFVCGILIAVPVIFLGQFLGELLGVSDTSGSPVDLAIYAFVVVALSEEGMKYLVLRWYNYPHREFDEPYDGIMYGVAVSLGFAAIENVLYVFTSEDGFSTAMVRMFTAVPAHASFGVMMGFFVGRAKFTPGINPFTERMKGLLTAIFFHGLYDYFLFLGIESLAIISFIGLGVTVFLANRAIRLHAADSERRNRRSVRNPFFDPD